MNMAEYIQALENYVASRKLNLGDGESSIYERTGERLLRDVAGGYDKCR